MAEIDKKVGMVDAYAFAVAGGYKGTREEFEQMCALVPESVEELEQIQQEVEQAKADAQTSATNAGQSATSASGSATEANASEQNAKTNEQTAEAWAVGTKGGVDVPSTDEAYHNNAKYWAEKSNENQYGAYITKPASGSIASFADGGDDIPMKSVKVAIVPKQAGSGDPSPSNVRPITGTSTANVTVTGKNMFDSARFLDATNWTESGGVYTGDSSHIASNKDSGLPYLFKFDNPTAGQYSISFDAMSDKTYRTGFMLFKYSDGTQSAAAEIVGNTWTHYSGTSTTGKTVTEVAFLGSNSTALSIKNFQLETGSTATAYEPYTGHTTPVPLGQTVYGGEVDVATGVLTITKYMKTANGTEPDGAYVIAPSGNMVGLYMGVPVVTDIGMSNAFKHAVKPWGAFTEGEFEMAGNIAYFYVPAGRTIANAKAYIAQLGGVQFVGDLRTPTTVQLTPTQVATLLGTNNVWSDAGDVEVEYRADPTLAYAELQALILENN